MQIEMPIDHEKHRIAGRIAREALHYGMTLIKERMPLIDIAEETEHYVFKKGLKLAFPVNIAINEIAAHYTPSDNDKKKIMHGDLVKLDVGVHLEGHIADTAMTIEVGTTNYTQLINASRSALAMAISTVKNGIELSQVGSAISKIIATYHYRPIVNLSGHLLLPYILHAGKSVPNVGTKENGKMEKGEVYAIEPFATNGNGYVENWKNSNIYKVERVSPVNDDEGLNDFLRKIFEEFNYLPFAERWCAKFDPKFKFYLQRLKNKRVIKCYPIFIEKSRGMVAQFEHTVMVMDNGGEQIT